MISYDLQCSAAHRFEGWFGSSVDYGKQLERGLIQCPVCGTVDIQKILSAPNIGRKSSQSVQIPTSASVPPGPESAPPPSEGSAISVMSNKPDGVGDVGKLIEKIANVQKEMLKQSQWVGNNFAEEARAIHYGESAARQIHGEASAHDAKILTEEGISVAPLLFPYIPAEAKN